MAKDELFDEELQGLVKFTDATAKPVQPAQPAKVSSEPTELPNVGKTKQANEAKINQELKEIRNKRREPLVQCAKWVTLFGGLSLLFFYWQQTGQMQPTAALPCMYVCAVLVGVQVGQFLKESK